MSTDIVPPSQGPRTERPTAAANVRTQQKSGQRLSQLLFGGGLLLVLAVAAAMLILPGLKTDRGPKLLHNVQRGDLTVTITEQGTLESSDNTEIKCRVRGFSTVTWVIPSGTVVKEGDELVRLDTRTMEEAVSLGKTNVHTAVATLEKSKANVARSEIAVQAYLEGRFVSQLKMLEKEIVIAESNLNTAREMQQQSEALFKKGYVTDLEVQGNAYAVTEAELELNVKKTELDVLQKYTKKMQLETLNGNLIANKSKLQADVAGLAMDTARRDRALEELAACEVRAERSGLVIYPSAAAWKDSPDIAEGATVRKDQILLLMPDLEKMQVKVGIHESMIERMSPGLKARVTLPDRTLRAEVSSVATVTRPAGWWTGNVVKYDTIIKLPSDQGLKPGMSAEVEIILAEHVDVLTVPVVAVVETEEGFYCWVKTDDGVQRRSIKLGDSNNVFVIVDSGLKEGDQIVLNPLAYVDDAQDNVLRTLDQKSDDIINVGDTENGNATESATPTDDNNEAEPTDQAARFELDGKPTGAPTTLEAQHVS